MTEPRFSIARFNQAALRLEVLRGLERVPNRLMLRVLRRYGACVVDDDVDLLAMRFVDRGDTDAVAS